eukprot:151132_1
MPVVVFDFAKKFFNTIQLSMSQSAEERERNAIDSLLMKVAIKRSKRDALTQSSNILKEQNEEYEKALQEAKDTEELQSDAKVVQEKQANTINDDIVYNTLNDPNENDLDALPLEAEENNECVYIRAMLSNGVRIERRFHYKSNIGNVILWVQHELINNHQFGLINNFKLIS